MSREKFTILIILAKFLADYGQDVVGNMGKFLIR
jgi:hypothetical protein